MKSSHSQSMLVATLLMSLGAACKQDAPAVIPPPGEVLLYIDTDAPVPTGRATTSPLDVAPLFDRLRIEVIEPGKDAPCETCTNEFSIDTALFQSRSASVGILPPPNVAGYRARIRMFYRALGTAEDDPSSPNPDVTIERVVTLPVVAEHGEIDVTVTMLTSDVGVPVGSLASPVAVTAAGAPGTSLVGTWPGAQRVDCTGGPPATASESTVCVPGGAYWMGDRRKLFAVLPSYDVNRARLITIAPFFLDAHEVTVAEYRADNKGRVDFPRDGADGSLGSDFCNFTKTVGTRESFPVNCVLQKEAQKYCARRGGDLPTEAEFEYVASGLQNHSFVWGDDLPACEDAVYARVGWGAFIDSLAPCRPPKPYGGAEATGSGARDQLVLRTGTIVDLIGNVGEWQRDLWNTANESCWSRPGVYVDPVCASPGAAIAGTTGEHLFAIKGGSWAVNAGQLDRTSRAFATDQTTLLDTGFRCSFPISP